MIMNVFRTIEPISWMLGPKWQKKQRSKQGLQGRILTPPPPPTGPSRGSRHWPIHSVSIIACPMLGNPRKFWILDSTPGIPDSRYWIPVFFNGTWILAPIVGGIPDSLSCTPNPHAKISQITESGFPYTGRYGHQIALCSSNCEIHLRRVWPKCRWQALEYTVCI